MNATPVSTLAAEAPAYARLQREMHDALLAQHPEWVLPNGDCPTCDSYDARFAELLFQTLTTRLRRPKRDDAPQFQFELPYLSAVAMAH
ncbi:MAG TPA: hypothetical protein VJ063_06625 [Verrucomicrobiae bacterium]|nr:hypothetical protein [Verrucomicrobiae bacterium]